MDAAEDNPEMEIEEQVDENQAMMKTHVTTLQSEGKESLLSSVNIDTDTSTIGRRSIEVKRYGAVGSQCYTTILPQDRLHKHEAR